MRAALIDTSATRPILIATEAAAEGINLQFCNLVVNYDLPWNPQRIEQRIGRCHRYGQKFDVVVVNFLNRANAADRRVYQLLDEKFRLFSGVFGASDEVLGAIETGVDFEKRIAAIYQSCRTPEQIEFEFNELQQELETEIAVGQRVARDRLLDNFDQEVVEKVRIDSSDFLDRFNERLWTLTRHVLAGDARFDNANWSFLLHRNPFADESIHRGPYRMGKQVEDANTYRVGHPLAQHVLELGRTLPTPSRELRFQCSESRKKIAILEPLVGQSGWLACSALAVNALEAEDYLVFAGISDAGLDLDEPQCRRLFDLPGIAGAEIEPTADVAQRLREELSRRRQGVLEGMSSRDGRWFESEMDKLDRWAEDRRGSLKTNLEELDEGLKEARKSARAAGTLPEKLERQREVRTLESKRDDAWRAFDQASREIDREKEGLLDKLSDKLAQQPRADALHIRWTVT
jgi:hypothetical protein